MTTRSPLVTQQAPAFNVAAVVRKEIKNVSLEEYKGKWVVLVWYPLDFTFGTYATTHVENYFAT